jgi:hypothetical protein
MTSPEEQVMEPDEAHASAFVDALLGAFSLLRKLDGLVADAAPVATFPGDDVELPAAAENDGPPRPPVDALLGLLSFRKTLGLLLEAVLDDAGEPSRARGDGRPAHWGREVFL